VEGTGPFGPPKPGPVGIWFGEIFGPGPPEGDGLPGPPKPGGVSIWAGGFLPKGNNIGVAMPGPPSLGDGAEKGDTAVLDGFPEPLGQAVDPLAARRIPGETRLMFGLLPRLLPEGCCPCGLDLPGLAYLVLPLFELIERDGVERCCDPPECKVLAPPPCAPPPAGACPLPLPWPARAATLNTNPSPMVPVVINSRFMGDSLLRGSVK
jgi:hypothetical protein